MSPSSLALAPAVIDLVQTDKIKWPAKVPNDPLFSPSATFPGQWFYPVRAQLARVRRPSLRLCVLLASTSPALC